MTNKTISGQRQMDFVSKFNFIREAGTLLRQGLQN